MKPLRDMRQEELAAFIQSHLRTAGIDVILSGGSAVAFYSSHAYVSRDIDLVNAYAVRRRDIRAVMLRLGFTEKGRYFIHPATDILVEFPEGPLSVGEEPVQSVQSYELETGVLKVISPTDCVKDRLCAYYFWNDRQGLAQAVMVAKNQSVDLEEIERWSKVEKKAREFILFKSQLGF